MKLKFKTVLSICLLLLSSSLMAQQKQGTPFRAQQFDYGMMKPTTIGTSKIRVKYAFQAQDLKNENTWIDCGQLLADKGLTQYSSFFLAENDAALREWMKKHANQGYHPNAIKLKGRMRDYWSEYQYSQIFVRGNELTEWAVMPSPEFQQWRYKETYPSMKWTLGKETKTICGYKCQKATTRWRGRNYEAWFTQQIPLKSGPWKFGGLPGLILKIYDTIHLYTWEAVAVENGSFPILQLEEKRFKDTDRKKVWKMQYDFNVKYNELSGRMAIGSTVPLTKRVPYDQLELE